MKSTFSRATIGFLFLTLGLIAISFTALWALDTYTDVGGWPPLLIIAIALVSEIAIYRPTLHEPIKNWITEPKRLADEAKREIQKE